MSNPTSLCLPGKKTSEHVSFPEMTGEDPTRDGKTHSSSQSKAIVTLPPPPSGTIKDEVELLRENLKNRTGENIQSQAK